MEYNKEEIETLINIKMKDYEKKYGKDFRMAVIDVLSLEKMLAPVPAQAP